MTPPTGLTEATTTLFAGRRLVKAHHRQGRPAQLSHTLLEEPTAGGAARTLALLLVVWSVWATTAWVTNWLDPDQLPVRLCWSG
jgi:Bacterial low temperature requirement A protein (LtrA)